MKVKGGDAVFVFGGFNEVKPNGFSNASSEN